MSDYKAFLLTCDDDQGGHWRDNIIITCKHTLNELQLNRSLNLNEAIYLHPHQARKLWHSLGEALNTLDNKEE